MRRRILGSMLMVGALAVCGFGVPLALVVQDRYYDEALLDLSTQASTAAVSVPGSFAQERDTPELPDPARDIDVALYDADGRRVIGEGPDLADGAVTAVLELGAAQQRRHELTVVVPVSNEETVVGAIRTHLSDDVVAARTHRTWLAMTGLATMVLGATGLIAGRRSRTLSRPILTLRDDAVKIGAGGPMSQLCDSGIAEIDAVREALAQSGTRLASAMTRERELSADLAHQIRTPLASLRIRLEQIQRLGGAESEGIQASLDEVDRLEGIVGDVLTLARNSERPHRPVPLATLLRTTVEAWEPRVATTGRRLDYGAEPTLPWVQASPAAVGQILDVLLDNALTHGEGTIQIRARRVGPGAVVSVRDDGSAVVDPAAIFVRGGSEASGAGIGLAFARRLADAEGLRLVLANPGPGPAFHLTFGALQAADPAG